MRSMLGIQCPPPPQKKKKNSPVSTGMSKLKHFQHLSLYLGAMVFPVSAFPISGVLKKPHACSHVKFRFSRQVLSLSLPKPWSCSINATWFHLQTSDTLEDLEVLHGKHEYFMEPGNFTCNARSSATTLNSPVFFGPSDSNHF